jgi:hypothetical protein
MAATARGIAFTLAQVHRSDWGDKEMNTSTPEPRGVSRTLNGVRDRPEVNLDFASPYLQELSQGCVVPGFGQFLRFAGTKDQFLRAGIPDHVWPEGREYVRLSIYGWNALLRYSHERPGPSFELFVDWETPDAWSESHARATLAAKVRFQDSTYAGRQAWRMTQLLIALYQTQARKPRG